MQNGYKTKENNMSYGILFWVMVIILAMSEGMRTWTWFDGTCIRIYSQWISTKWHLEYLAEEARRNLLIKQWEEFEYNGEEE